MRPYNTTEEMENYIASNEYKSDKKHPGVCMAIEQIKDPQNPNNYTFKLHYPDKNFDPLKKLHYSQGIPDQSNPPWSPFDSSPDLLSYTRYNHNGLNF
mmetsp:Transcript_6764/g.9286  ORF Transcript_6764/g.9286 Transcript_6764/m.9286 type:complete len:98 (+) Transcript_6764:368-661(+)